MLAYLNGTIKSKEMTSGSHDRMVVEVSGVGFELTVARRTLLALGSLGDEATVHTALSIRETEWTIFGFASLQEREMFQMLQSVTGVGPKLALALIGTLGPDELSKALISEDHRLISQTPGVGPKVAQRLILELKGKVADWHHARGLALSSSKVSSEPAFDEVNSILDGLGYTQSEIHQALAKARQENIDHDVELLVRYTLKVLGAASR